MAAVSSTCQGTAASASTCTGGYKAGSQSTVLEAADGLPQQHWRPLLWCRLSWWKPCAEYFDTKLIKTADLDPEQRYIFVVAPHGVVTMFCWPCFDTDATGFSEKFPGN